MVGIATKKYESLSLESDKKAPETYNVQGTIADQINSELTLYISGLIENIGSIKLIKPDNVVGLSYRLSNGDLKKIEFIDKSTGKPVPTRYNGSKIQILEDGTFINFADSRINSELFGKPTTKEASLAVLYNPPRIAELKTLSVNTVKGLDGNEYILRDLGKIQMKTREEPLKVTGYYGYVDATCSNTLGTNDILIMPEATTTANFEIFSDLSGRRIIIKNLPVTVILLGAKGSEPIAYIRNTDNEYINILEASFSLESLTRFDPEAPVKFEQLFAGNFNEYRRFFTTTAPKKNEPIVSATNSQFPNPPSGISEVDWSLLTEEERTSVYSFSNPDIRRMTARGYIDVPPGYTEEKWRPLSARQKNEIIDAITTYPVPEGVSVEDWQELTTEEKRLVYSHVNKQLRIDTVKDMLVVPSIVTGYSQEEWRSLSVKEKNEAIYKAASEIPPPGVLREDWAKLTSAEKDFVWTENSSGVDPRAMTKLLITAPEGTTQDIWNSYTLQQKVNIIDLKRAQAAKDITGRGVYKQNSVIKQTEAFAQRELPVPNISELLSKPKKTFLQEYGPKIFLGVFAIIGLAYYGKNKVDFEGTFNDREDILLKETIRKTAIDSNTKEKEAINEYREGAVGLQAADALITANEDLKGDLEELLQ